MLRTTVAGVIGLAAGLAAGAALRRDTGETSRSAALRRCERDNALLRARVEVHTEEIDRRVACLTPGAPACRDPLAPSPK